MPYSLSNLRRKPTPLELYNLYSSGKVIGGFCDCDTLPNWARAESRKAFGEFKDAIGVHKYRFGDRFSGRYTDNQGLYINCLANLVIDPKYGFGSQNGNDCVSWGTSGSNDNNRLNEAVSQLGLTTPEQMIANKSILLRRYIAKGATSILYASRGYRGDNGMSCATAHKSLKEDGVLHEIKYLNGAYDFTDYEKYWRYGVNWGGTGVPEELLAITRQTKMKETSYVGDMSEVDAVIRTGRSLSVCSSIGVSRSADGKGLSRLSGSWSHCMQIFGADYTKSWFNEDVYFWDQSWGNWNDWKETTNKVPYLRELRDKYGIIMPEGFFILNKDDTAKAIRRQGTFTSSLSEGYPDLTHINAGVIGRLAL